MDDDVLVEPGADDAARGHCSTTACIRLRRLVALHQLSRLVGKASRCIAGRRRWSTSSSSGSRQRPDLSQVAERSVHVFSGKSPEIRLRIPAGNRSWPPISWAAATASTASAAPAFPARALTVSDRGYPSAGVRDTSASPPAGLICSYHERGFALYTMRSPTLAGFFCRCTWDNNVQNSAGCTHMAGAGARLRGTHVLAEGGDAGAFTPRCAASCWSRSDVGTTSLRRTHASPPHPGPGREPRPRRRGRAFSRHYRLRPLRQQRPPRPLLGDMPRRVSKAPRFSWWMTRLPFFRPCTTHSIASASWPSSITSPARPRRDARLPENYAGFRSKLERVGTNADPRGRGRGGRACGRARSGARRG